jgi:hypothetical protein
MHRRMGRGLCASIGMLAVVVALGLALAPGAGASVVGSEDASTAPGVGPAHWSGPNGTYGNFGAPPPLGFFSTLAVDNLTNTGPGEIMPTTNTHLIFWLPPGTHYSSSLGDANYEAQMIKYFKDVGGSQILNTTTQYPGTNGTPADTSTLIASIVDTTAFPHTGADVTRAVTQTDLNTEVFNDINANGWSYGLSDMYFVFLPNAIVDCNDALTSCNTNKYCAYHTYGFKGGSDTPANDFVWADIPDNLSPTTTLGGCGDSNVTGDESADTTLSSVEHEHLEAVTDPRLNAWQNSTGGAGENGDKCNREMGVADSSKTITSNFLGGGATDQFRIQREWSNAVSGCAASYTTTGSGVESPAPTGGDVTLSVAEATIAGNPADSLDYTLTFRNPSNQDDAFTITLPNTPPTGVSTTTSFNLGNLAPHQMVTRTFVGHPTGPLAAGTILTDTAVFAFNDSTGASQPTITRTATTTVVNAPPVLDPLPGPQSVDYHDALSFGVSATDANAGDTLSLSATGLPAGLSLADHGDRTATVSGTATDVPGVYTVAISVDDLHNPPVSATMTVTVTREESTTAYTGPLVILEGAAGAALSAHFYEDTSDAASPVGQSITLALGPNSCVATVLPSDVASCLVPVTVALGPEPLSATFGGDTYYRPSSDAGKIAIVFAMPSGGSFVLGDNTVAAATGSSTTVTWWGAKWTDLNTIGGGAAPNAFKGFVDTIAGLPTTSPPPSCSGTFGSRGGNSSSPPGSVPSYMGVLVTGSTTKSGSDVNGAWNHITVVKVAPGYAANPGHAGTGTIVATYC